MLKKGGNYLASKQACGDDDGAASRPHASTSNGIYSWWLYSLCLVMEEEKKKNKKGYSLSDDSWAPEGKPSHSDWSGGWGGNGRHIAMVIQWGDKLDHQIELLFSEKSWKPRVCYQAGMPLLWVVGLRFALVQVMSSCFFPWLKQEAKLTVCQKARKVWVQKSCTSQHFMAVSSIIAAFRTDKHFCGDYSAFHKR